ncbi:hypothetical protein Mapa_000234 [Marchantia paleacea]|nr:hypothetical protein Mapa_000234 [Marchantia paleacea]
MILSRSSEELLGSPLFEPLYAELDKRKATVFVHPSQSPCPGQQSLDESSTGLPPSAVDFLLDTTRAAVNLIFRNVTRRYPNVKYVFAHSGGFLSFSTFRIVRVLMMLTNQTEEAIMSQLQTFYVDTALSASKYALPSTISLLGTSHLTFGSDFPFAPAVAYVPNTENLDQFIRESLNPDASKQINVKSATHLFSHILSEDILITMGF